MMVNRVVMRMDAVREGMLMGVFFGGNKESAWV